MKSRLLSVSMTLPMFLIGAERGFASNQLIRQVDFQFLGNYERTSEVTLDTQTLPPFTLAARTTDTEENCRLVGLCGDNGGNK